MNSEQQEKTSTPASDAKGPKSGPVQKAKDFKGTAKRLLAYLGPHSRKLMIVILCAILSVVFSVLSPKILGKATTRLLNGIIGKVAAYQYHQPVPSIDFNYIGMIILVLIGLYIISCVFSYIQQYLMAGVAQKTVFDMRREVIEKLARLPLKYFDGQSHGDIMSRVSNDIDNISNTLQQSLTQLITAVCTFIGVLVMMLTISPVLTLITVLVLPIAFVVPKLLGKMS
jgi:ATP-binding cassette subfamily B multidrug efflux pump